jgi:tRNA(Ile)-lysidine synthase
MKPAAAIAVAVSGGRDSMALLHCTAAQASALGLRVVALHVHHGLMADADEWAAIVQRTCTRWAAQGKPLSFALHKLEGQPAKGDSVEAWAREHRYAALTQMARAAGATAVLLAQHQDDQAETVLLQALRGAGPAGLAAMPVSIERDGITWMRPWLAMPGSAIETYAKRHRLRYVQDPSNTDPRFARSRLRAEVMPVLRAAFPDSVQALAAVAQRCAQAQAVLDEVVAADLATVAPDGALHVPARKRLSDARGQAVLHAWLNAQTGGRAQSAGVVAVSTLLREGRSGSVADVVGGQVRLYRGRLSFAPTGKADEARIDQHADIHKAGRYEVPGGGVLLVRRCQQQGVPLAMLATARWVSRRGGEQFQRAPNTPPRSLKKAFQAAGVPEWQRQAPLLVGADGDVIFVPSLGVDARAVAATGEPQVSLVWLDAAPPARRQARA